MTQLQQKVEEYIKTGTFNEEEFDRIIESASELDLKFLTKAMLYVRSLEQNNLSHHIAILLVENLKGTTYLRPALLRSFPSPEDLISVLNKWNTRNPNKMVPNVLRRAFKDALELFHKDDLKRYLKQHNLSLRDIIRLAHPKGDFKEIMEIKGDNLINTLCKPNSSELSVIKNIESIQL